MRSLIVPLKLQNILNLSFYSLLLYVDCIFKLIKSFIPCPVCIAAPCHTGCLLWINYCQYVFILFYWYESSWAQPLPLYGRVQIWCKKKFYVPRESFGDISDVLDDDSVNVAIMLLIAKVEYKITYNFFFVL